jgi:hypothetical protein
MDALTAIWLASGTGAALFFAAGFLSARRKGELPLPAGAAFSGSAPAAAGPGVDLAHLLVESGTTNVEPLEFDQEPTHTLPRHKLAAEIEIGNLRQQLADLARETERLRRQNEGLGSAQRDAAREARRLAELGQRLGELERERERTLAQAAEQAHRLAQAERESGELRQRAAELEQKAAAAAELEREREWLVARWQEAQRDTAELAELRAAQQAHQDLAIKVSVLEGRLAQQGELEQENQRLRARDDERAALEARLAELNREVASLRAQGLVYRKPPVAPIAPRGGGSGGTAQALDALLQRLATAPGMRSAALADELGLPVMGLGEHTNQLAAFAGLMEDATRKAREFLPLGPVRRISLEDESRLTVSTCPLSSSDTSLALVTLTVGPGPTTAQMQEIVRGSVALFQPASGGAGPAPPA